MNNLTNSGLAEYLKKLLYIKTVYMWGCFGQLVTNELVDAKRKQFPKNYSDKRVAYLRTLVGKGYRGFDCVCSIKSYFWGGYEHPHYNASQDTTASGMLARATIKGKINTLPEKIGLGVFKPGHIGVYIGNGYVIETTLGSYGDGTVKTRLQGRGWTDWLQFPYCVDNSKVEQIKDKISDKIETSKNKVEAPKTLDNSVFIKPPIFRKPRTATQTQKLTVSEKRLGKL